jgi:hypothetical protein
VCNELRYAKVTVWGHRVRRLAIGRLMKPFHSCTSLNTSPSFLVRSSGGRVRRSPPPPPLRTARVPAGQAIAVPPSFPHPRNPEIRLAVREPAPESVARDPGETASRKTSLPVAVENIFS